jgi:hypothetical protein
MQSAESANLSSNFYNDPANFEISDGDATGVEVKVHRGATISGVVVVEGGANAAAPQLMISATSRGQQGQGQGQRGQGGGSGRQSAAQVGANGAFTISGLAAGSVRLNVNDFGGGPGRGGGGLTLVRIERNGAAINGDFEIASGQQVAGVRVVVGYGTGVIQGKVILVSGAPPAGTRLMVTARSLNSTGGGGQNRPAQVDASGNFRIEGLYSGSYEVRVNAITMGIGGQGQGGQGRGGQRGGGNQNRVRVPSATQTVTVTNGAVASVNLNLDLSQQ